MADAAPDQESTFYRDTADLDVDPRSDVILRIAMSKDLWHFLSGEVYQKKVRWTNEAHGPKRETSGITPKGPPTALSTPRRLSGT